jgi:O-antigen ligase
LVDNLYVSWLFQYGLLGAALCLVWFAVLLRPVLAVRRNSAVTAASLVGVFLVVGASTVSLWEESPTDFLAAIVFAFAIGWKGRPVTETETTSRTSGATGASGQASSRR